MLARFCFFSVSSFPLVFFFFFNDTATTEIYTLSLHDALPILWSPNCWWTFTPTFAPASALTKASPYTGPSGQPGPHATNPTSPSARKTDSRTRSEEHTSELQSLTNLVCRLLLEKKKKTKKTTTHDPCYSNEVSNAISQVTAVVCASLHHVISCEHLVSRSAARAVLLSYHDLRLY